MPVHDWTRVEASTFHDFHARWITHLTEALNGGLLPAEYYARSEQHLGRKIGDILSLHSSDPTFLRTPPVPRDGAVALLDTPPRVGRTQTFSTTVRRLRRTLTVRHTSGHRIIALVELVSPGNKSSAGAVAELARKVSQALDIGIHVVLLDLLPPGDHDPSGSHGALLAERGEGAYELPPGKPLTFVSYAADTGEITAYLEHLAVGAELPELPLFLTPEYYVNLPLRATYDVTFAGTDLFLRQVLEGRTPPPSQTDSASLE